MTYYVYILAKAKNSTFYTGAPTTCYDAYGSIKKAWPTASPKNTALKP